MVKNPNTIHVWAAGNGASDGLGLGLVASNQNGALHLASDSTERRLGNVIVVGAMLRNGKLASYSAYGGLVDVAAPTEFKGTNGTNAFTVSAEYGVATIPKNGNFLLGTASFSGTSAAAPVVTGIISLILDANPDLTPADVKKILISTASKKITKRETSLLGGEEDTPQIPIVDAEAAVKEAIKRRTLPACENQINIINRGSDFNINDDASWGSPTCKSGAIHVTARASSGNIYFKIDNPSLTATYSYGCDKSATSWYCNGYVPFTEVLLDANNDGQVTPGTDFSLSIGTRDYGDDELQSRSCQVWYPPNYTPWIPNAPIGYRTTPYVFSGAVRRISETSSYGMSIDACGSINLVFSSSAAGDTPHYIISMKNSFSSINQSDAGAKMFRVRLREFSRNNPWFLLNIQ